VDNFPSGAPAAARADLAALRAALDASPIPKTLDRNLLIATWNVRAFGKVLPKWESQAGDSPRRNLRDKLCLVRGRSTGNFRRRQAGRTKTCRRTELSSQQPKAWCEPSLM
jgi:hypothetical protein